MKSFLSLSYWFRKDTKNTSGPLQKLSPSCSTPSESNRPPHATLSQSSAPARIVTPPPSPLPLKSILKPTAPRAPDLLSTGRANPRKFPSPRRPLPPLPDPSTPPPKTSSTGDDDGLATGDQTQIFDPVAFYDDMFANVLREESSMLELDGVWQTFLEEVDADYESLLLDSKASQQSFGDNCPVKYAAPKYHHKTPSRKRASSCLASGKVTKRRRPTCTVSTVTTGDSLFDLLSPLDNLLPYVSDSESATNAGEDLDREVYDDLMESDLSLPPSPHYSTPIPILKGRFLTPTPSSPPTSPDTTPIATPVTPRGSHMVNPHVIRKTSISSASNSRSLVVNKFTGKSFGFEGTGLPSPPLTPDRTTFAPDILRQPAQPVARNRQQKSAEELYQAISESYATIPSPTHSNVSRGQEIAR